MTTNTKVICISGKAQHGKDTTAKYLKEILESRHHSVLIAHYADLVKYVCKTFFDWDGEKNEAGRSLLQYVGTDMVRRQNPDFWVDFIASILKFFDAQWEFVLIPDCRFPNEIDHMKELGFDVTTLRVVRPGFSSPLTPQQQLHESEIALDDYKFDYIVENEADRLRLREKLVAYVDEWTDTYDNFD